METPLYKKKWKAMVFILPALLFFIILIIYPFFVNIFNSFFDISALGNSIGKWNDGENYRNMLTDPNLHTAFFNTLRLMVMVIIFQGGIALILALIVDSVGRGTQLYRTIYFFPMVISATALGLMFNLLYLYPQGPLNNILVFMGSSPVIFKGEGNAFWAMLIPTIWQYVGFYFVLYLTGINNISEEINEAAKIDGATGLRRVFAITIPLLRNVLVTGLVLQITGAFKVFDLVWTLLPGGQPMGSTYLLGTYMYQMTFINRNVDYGATIAVVIVLLGAVLSQLTNGIFGRKGEEY